AGEVTHRPRDEERLAARTWAAGRPRPVPVVAEPQAGGAELRPQDVHRVLEVRDPAADLVGQPAADPVLPRGLLGRQLEGNPAGERRAAEVQRAVERDREQFPGLLAVLVDQLAGD